MRNMKLFPKTFLYTFTVMIFITVLAHLLLFLFAPQMIMSTPSIFENGIYIDHSLNSASIIKVAMLKALPISLLACTLISLLCSLLFSKMITTPIKMISQTTEKMSEFDQSLQCPIMSNDEIGMLAKNINQLYADLISTINNLEKEKQKVSEIEQSKLDFLRSASHELKTPVTALNAILENMILEVGKYKDRDTYLLECKEITTRLSKMIKEILKPSCMDFFSESQNKTSFDLAQTLPLICEPFQFIAKAKQIDFHIDIQASCLLNMSKSSLEKIIANLLSNAVSYTEPYHSIIISLQEHRLVIKNECVPIPDEKLIHVFEPFYRPDFARARKDGGNGLGLYIVDVLSKLLDLQYTFEPSNDPSGMQFILYL